MLGKMELGVDFDKVLKEAQDLGFAEADPTADIEGYDVRAKIAILAKLAFGTTVPIKSIPCMGITRISPIDFAYTKNLDSTIKLVGTAERVSGLDENDESLRVYVSPTVVPNSNMLASTRGSGNAVVVTSSNLETASFTGKGAGRYPTANSVVADIYRVASRSCVVDPFPRKSNIDLNNDYESSFYVRLSIVDGLGILEKVGSLAKKHGISLNSVLQNPITDPMQAEFVLTTDSCKCSQAFSMCDDIEKEDFNRDKPLCIPML